MYWTCPEADGLQVRKITKGYMKGQKLSDGQVIGMRHRLTDVKVDKLQNYNGLAI